MTVVTSSVKASSAGASRQLSPRVLAAGILTVLLVLFALFNLQTVRVHWIFATTHAPLVAVVGGCGVVGMVIGWLLTRRRAARRGR